MLKKITSHLERRLLQSSRYRWYFFTPRVSRETIQPLLCRYGTYAAGGHYQKSSSMEGKYTPVPHSQLRANREIREKRIVYLCDGQTIYGGLADRMKGIISLFAICQELGYDFRIHFVSPCRLEDYLEPATYDWRISPSDLHCDTAAMLVLENTDDARYQTRKQAEWLRHRLQEGPAEIHVITNANYAYELDYSGLFRQLFRPSPRLQEALEKELAALSGPFVSLSTRFLTLLGDFRETNGYYVLPEDEAEDLIRRTLHEVERLHRHHPENRLLVNSDSVRFLSRVAELPYVHVVKGGVAHTDLMPSENAEQMHLKLFLDFLLISRANYVYLLRSGLMRESGYPYAASRLGGNGFEVVEY